MPAGRKQKECKQMFYHCVPQGDTCNSLLLPHPLQLMRQTAYKASTAMLGIYNSVKTNDVVPRI